MKSLIFAITLFLTGCASNPYVPKPITDRVDGEYGTVDGQRIGMNDKKEVIIQKERSGEAELKVQQLENYQTEQKLTSLYDKLTQCRKELADPRMGGDGKMTEIPELDSIKGTPEVREEIGLGGNGEFKVVRREYYMDRLKLERRYGETMIEMLKTITRFHKSCNQEFGVARVKVGLPAERYAAVGHFDPMGTWVMERKSEKTLDDAFEIRAMIQGDRTPASR